jgi:hypothetical protein
MTKTIPGAHYSGPSGASRKAGTAKAATATPAALKSFPALRIDQTAYRQEIANHLHDPFNKALVELFWHGTEDYLRFIARDGLAAQQTLLAQIRHGRAYYIGLGNDLKLFPAKSEKALIESGADPIKAATFQKMRDRADTFLQHGDTLTKADERLTVALMHYLERNGDTPQSVQPIINITNEIAVEPTPVTLEASINMPAEIAVTLPARQTVSTVERNLAGEIISTSQIEKSI